jgi:hypothetical protein
MIKNDNSQLLAAEYNRGFKAACDQFKVDIELGKTAMRFVDRAGDVHPGIDDAETICADFYKAMITTLDKNTTWLRK